MFEERYARILHEERLQQVAYARQMRTGQLSTRSAQSTLKAVAARVRFNRVRWLPRQAFQQRLFARS